PVVQFWSGSRFTLLSLLGEIQVRSGPPPKAPLPPTSGPFHSGSLGPLAPISRLPASGLKAKLRVFADGSARRIVAPSIARNKDEGSLAAVGHSHAKAADVAVH